MQLALVERSVWIKPDNIGSTYSLYIKIQVQVYDLDPFIVYLFFTISFISIIR